ncbi:MAG: YgiT-type zinc finger protein [bacterium]|nr:YgiT-type zinc finger protein [bacterium]
MYGYSCEYCAGTVRERVVEKEVFKHKSGFVMLENVPIGICDTCGYRYYHSKIVKRVDEISEGKGKTNRTVPIPVAKYTYELAS